MKKKLAIIGIIILVLLLGFFIYVNFNTKKIAENKLKKLGNEFYDYYYDEQNTDNKGSDFLKNYSKIGITINLRDLKVYLDNHKIENYKIFSKCDETNTKITIFPFSPYGKNDRVIETTLDCNF